MRKIFLLSIPFIIFLMAYTLQHPTKHIPPFNQITSDSLINPEGKTIYNRILTPAGYERIPVEENSFAYYLRHLRLKPHGSDVRFYNGQIKTNRVHVAVIDMDIGAKDLQQCADAVIRLRAEYLYHRKLYGLIHFNFTNGFRADFAQWANGYRIEVKDNQARWIWTKNSSNDYAAFRQYLDVIFTYAGTFSLAQEMAGAEWQDIQPGDVLIRGGAPGHAVIVVDVAVNPSTGKKIFLLAQSFMPAQEIHVLMNPSDTKMNPWYEVDPNAEQIKTPEWDFYTDELRRFQ
jgi:hypothetical protein